MIPRAFTALGCNCHVVITRGRPFTDDELGSVANAADRFAGSVRKSKMKAQ